MAAAGWEFGADARYDVSVDDDAASAGGRAGVGDCDGVDRSVWGAAKSGDLTLLRELVDEDARNVDLQNGAGATPLHVAGASCACGPLSARAPVLPVAVAPILPTRLVCVRPWSCSVCWVHGWRETTAGARRVH